MSSTSADFLRDFGTNVWSGLSDQQRQGWLDRAKSRISRFSANPISNQAIGDDQGDGDVRPQNKTVVDTRASDQAIADSAKGGGTGVASDTGLGGRDFVEYFANASNDNGDSDAFLKGYAERARKATADNQLTSVSALDRNLNKSIQNSYDKAYVSQVMTFGDQYNENYEPPKWVNSAPDEIERPNFRDLYNDIAGDL